MECAREMARPVLGVLPDVDNRPARLADGCQGDGVELFARGAPCGDATGQLADDLLVADVAGLPDDVGSVLALIEDDDDGRVRGHEPAQPGAELRPQCDRDRRGIGHRCGSHANQL